MDAYRKWMAERQEARNKRPTSSVFAANAIVFDRVDTPLPPLVPHPTIFHADVEQYCCEMTTAPSPDFHYLAEQTSKEALFAPCMVGVVEGQFLKMVARMTKAKRVLDIGTFTGYSALAFAEGVVDGGTVITIEGDAATAEVARRVIANAKYGGRVQLVEGDARVIMDDIAKTDDKFDIIFLDADKANYQFYYETGLKMLNEGGCIMADNALMPLVSAEDDPVRKTLHDFAQFVRADERVEQVLLTVREGILLVQKKN